MVVAPSLTVTSASGTSRRGTISRLAASGARNESLPASCSDCGSSIWLQRRRAIGFVKGKRSSGYFAVATLDGTPIHNSVKATTCIALLPVPPP